VGAWLLWEVTRAYGIGPYRRDRLSRGGRALAHHSWLAWSGMGSISEGNMQYRLRKRVTRIGRSRRNDVAFPDDTVVSRFHAQVRREDGRYVLHDLGSTNGTRVNGRRVGRHTLVDGDVIQVGGEKLVYRHGTLDVPAHARLGGTMTWVWERTRVPPVVVRQNSTVFIILGAVGVLMLVALLALVLSPGVLWPPIPPKRDAESVARAWVRANREEIAKKIADQARVEVPVEYPVLLDRVREQVALDSTWRYKELEEVTEGVFRVEAITTFSVGMVERPDYCVTATYLLTIDLNQGMTKENRLQPVSVTMC